MRFWAPSLNWALVAEGKIDGIVIFDNEAEDLYPGILLVQEAGGVVCDFDGKNFDGEARRTSVIGCHPDSRDSILALVQSGLRI